MTSEQSRQLALIANALERHAEAAEIDADGPDTTAWLIFAAVFHTAAEVCHILATDEGANPNGQ